MRDTHELVSARASGTFDIGGETTVNRLGFGAMRLTGDGVWGEPRDPDEVATGKLATRGGLVRALELAAKDG
jgi:hypothetical protein